MINAPKTKREAENIKYGTWAGQPNGVAYIPTRCAFEVWNGPKGMTTSQCSRPNGFGISGLYCKQHAKKTVMLERTKS